MAVTDAHSTRLPVAPDMRTERRPDAGPAITRHTITKDTRELTQTVKSAHVTNVFQASASRIVAGTGGVGSTSGVTLTVAFDWVTATTFTVASTPGICQLVPTGSGGSAK